MKQSTAKFLFATMVWAIVLWPELTGEPHVTGQSQMARQSQVAVLRDMECEYQESEMEEGQEGWSEETLDVHHSGLLFDGHNDLPWEMRENANSSFDRIDISRPTEFHTDIPRLRKGGVKAQFWSVYVPAETGFTGNALILTLEQIRLVKDMCRRYPDDFELALTADDVLRIVGQGKIASLIGVEGGHSIQNSIGALHELYAQGARYMTLTHSRTLAWADSCTDEAKNNGLSEFGKEVVREMNRLGMLVDLSHVSPKCMRDALEVTEAPVIFSHSSARAVCDHVRNVPDDILRLTAKNGGVVMVTFVPVFVDPDRAKNTDHAKATDFKLVVDHIEHVIKIAGIDHVGIGSDFDGVPTVPVGLEDVSKYPNITQELLKRGYSKSDIHKVLGGNVIRVFRDAERKATRLKQQKRQHRADSPPVITLAAEEFDRKNLIVKELVGDSFPRSEYVTLADNAGNRFIGQLSTAGIEFGPVDGLRQLTFVLPFVAANETRTISVEPQSLTPLGEFTWHDDQSTQAQLQWGNSPVIQYNYEPLDEASPQRREETYKVYHHVFSADGKTLLTKGNGGLYPHHRGIFFGYNRIRYDGKTADVWHCNNGESQTHVAALEKIGGPVFGRDRNTISWNGKDGQPFAEETRQVTAYLIDGNTLIEFVSELRCSGSKVSLDGDPQHAGVQFRAAQSVADETKQKTYYVRPDGVDKPGSFRNWSENAEDAESNRSHVNLPWLSMVFHVGNRKLSCCYFDHADNPKPSRFSERDYGRFGCYFLYELTPEKPLRVKYRYWIQNGEISPTDANQMSSGGRW
jgi:membrane dipeptidase